MAPSLRSLLLLVVTVLGLALRLESTPPASAVLQGRGWLATVREGSVMFETSGPAGPAQLELGAATIERGGASLGTVTGALRHRGDEVHVDRGAFVSHFTGTPEGLELSWVFPRAPEGRGDLVVSFSASAGARTLHGGVQWSAASLGPATWVDASGQRTAVEVQSVSGRLEYVVSTALLERSTFPAVLDPLLTPVNRIDPTGRLGPLDGEHREVGLAFNGTNWLAVWLDRDPANGVVLTTLVDGVDGGVGSAVKAAVGTGPSPVSAPAVAASTGTSAGFLVVWQENGIKGAVVSPAGVMGSPVTITSALDAANPAVSWRAATGQYLVAWENNGTLGAAWLQPVMMTFSVSSQVFQVGVAGTEPAVACSTSECLVAFTSVPGAATDIAGLRFSSPTVVPSSVTIWPGPGAQRSPTVSWTGSTWVVAWVDDSIVGSPNLGLARSDSMLGFLPMTVAISADSKDQPSIACDALRCTLVYRAVSLLQVQSLEFSLTATPNPSTRTFSMLPATPSAPAVALGAGQRLVAWSSTLGPTLIVGRLQADADPGPMYPVSVGPAAQENVALASSPDAGVLAVWSDTRFDTGDIFGRILSLDGGALGQSFAVTSGRGTQSHPAAAWNGSEWLVVFADESRQLLARRVSLDGGVNIFGTAEIIDGDGGSGAPPGLPSIAAAGSQLYTTWVENGSVFGARLSRPSVSLLVEPAGGLQLSDPARSCDRSAVASDGVSWLVAYSCTTGELSLVEVGPSGGLMYVPAVTGPISSPAIAFGDGRYLVVWREGIPGAPSAINGVFVTGRSRGPPFTIASAQEGRALPSVAWSPWGFVVTWQGGLSPGRSTSAARLFHGGVQFVGAVLPGLQDATAAAVACPASGRCLLAGSVDIAADGGRVAVRRELRNSPPVAVPSQVTVQGRTGFTFQATDDDGDTLTFLPGPTAFGTIVREPDGGWAYVPTAPMPDSALFRVFDGVDVSQSARVDFVVGAGGGAAGGGAAGGGAAGGAAGGGAAGGG
ncbi:MAG: Ig-like domain-containing protein, partial [Myxococcales bacterium]|nr:Ig-like domain-containing protein [Myxococcales bacterium]